MVLSHSLYLVVGEVELLFVHSVRRVLEFGRRLAFLTNEGHQEDVLPQDDNLRHPDPSLGHLDQVPHLLLGPHQDDFARILFAKSVSEPPVVLSKPALKQDEVFYAPSVR